MLLVKDKIVLVVDRNFGNRLAQIPGCAYIWIVESDRNTPIVNAYWASEGAHPNVDDTRPELTSFAASERESGAGMCVRLSGDLEDHHGEYAQDPPWHEIEVFGTFLNDEIQDAFEDIGGTDFEPTAEGFICRRPAMTKPDFSGGDSDA